MFSVEPRLFYTKDCWSKRRKKSFGKLFLVFSKMCLGIGSGRVWSCRQFNTQKRHNTYLQKTVTIVIKYNLVHCTLSITYLISWFVRVCISLRSLLKKRTIIETCSISIGSMHHAGKIASIGNSVESMAWGKLLCIGNELARCNHFMRLIIIYLDTHTIVYSRWLGSHDILVQKWSNWRMIELACYIACHAMCTVAKGSGIELESLGRHSTGRNVSIHTWQEFIAIVLCYN